MIRASYADYVKTQAQAAGCSTSEQVAVLGLVLKRKRRAVGRELGVNQAGVLALEQSAAEKMRRWADRAIEARGARRESFEGLAGTFRLIANGRPSSPVAPEFGVEPATGELQRCCYRAQWPSASGL